MYNPKIDALIEGWREEIYGTLKGWIGIDSTLATPAGEGKPFGENIRKALDLALSDAEKMGFSVRNIDGYAGEINLGHGEQTMGMLAHLDIVPAGDGWTHDPFGCERENGRVYGRGVQDDKGPAVAALYAMRAVKEAGIPLKDGVRLILGTDEESGMRGLRYYKEREKTPDYGFSPDADYPLINIEKGGIGIVLSAVSSGEVEAEIPIWEMNAGVRANVVPGTARAVVGTKNVSIEEMKARLAGMDEEKMPYEINITPLDGDKAQIEAVGVSAHASLPHLGLNAAGLLFKALKRMGAGGGIAEAVAALADKFGTEGHGESAGIQTDDEECGPLTCNVGILRFDGEKLEVTLDIRWPLATNEEKILGQMCMALSGTPLAVRRRSGHGVHHVPKEHKVVKGLLEVYHDVTGLPAYPIAIGGGTYSRMMPNTVAFGICFPGDVDTCHMPDEYIDWEKFILSVKIFAHAIEKLAGL
ncbi:MAG: dipeptidase PepV [Clostridia bacterium]|nr:dipeptidase PepV [Clostridia bacterium]